MVKLTVHISFITYGLSGILADPGGYHSADNSLLLHRQPAGALQRTFDGMQLHLLHETGVGILIGVIFGLILYFAVEVKELTFNEEIFFYGLLPPMIFAGGYNLKKKDFKKNFIYILTYGLLGTILVFGVVFGLTLIVSELHWIIALRSENNI
jgi:NhaP-type Na+/H+ or K+/H+ antiporter